MSGLSRKAIILSIVALGMLGCPAMSCIECHKALNTKFLLFGDKPWTNFDKTATIFLGLVSKVLSVLLVGLDIDLTVYLVLLVDVDQESRSSDTKGIFASFLLLYESFFLALSFSKYCL